MRIRTISDKKQKLIDAKNQSPLEVGEMISVLEKIVMSFTNNPDRVCTCTISSLDGGITVYEGIERDKNKGTRFVKITEKDIVSRNIGVIGENPFDESFDSIRPVAFTLESIIFGLDMLEDSSKRENYEIKGVKIREGNFNPFVYDKDGNKEYYQRPYCWSVEDKQLLVESIYQKIDCGKILVRLRGFKELGQMQGNGETELAFRDVVDGKQRLGAVASFIKGEFADLHGNFYGDLSASSQHRFTDHQLFSYAEMPERTKDETVLRQFLKLNFTGVPQSKKHIEFVKSLKDKI